jgi:hypothetical protein
MSIDPRLKPFLDELAELLADDFREDLKDVAQGKVDPKKLDELVKLLADMTVGEYQAKLEKEANEERGS